MSGAPICVRCGEEFDSAQVVAGEPCPRLVCDGILAEPGMGQAPEVQREGPTPDEDDVRAGGPFGA